MTQEVHVQSIGGTCGACHRPLKEPTESQKMITVRLPESVHAGAKRAAIRNGLSLNQYCVAALLERNAKQYGINEGLTVVVPDQTPEELGLPRRCSNL